MTTETAVANEIAARWQAAYDAWTDGLGASPSTDDLVSEAIDALGLEGDTVRDVRLADWLDARLNEQSPYEDLVDIATDLVARMEET